MVDLPAFRDSIGSRRLKVLCVRNGNIATRGLDLGTTPGAFVVSTADGTHLQGIEGVGDQASDGATGLVSRKDVRGTTKCVHHFPSVFVATGNPRNLDTGGRSGIGRNTTDRIAIGNGVDNNIIEQEFAILATLQTNGWTHT